MDSRKKGYQELYMSLDRKPKKSYLRHLNKRFRQKASKIAIEQIEEEFPCWRHCDGCGTGFNKNFFSTCPFCNSLLSS